MLSRLLYGLIFLAALALGAIVALDRFALSRAPLIASPPAATPKTAEQVRQLLKRLSRQAKAGIPFDAQVNASELAALPVVLARAYPQLATQLTHSPDKLIVSVTYQLPSPLSDRYLSARVTIPQGPVLRLEQLEVGALSLEGSLLNTLFRRMSSVLLGEEQARQLLNGSQLLSSNERGIVIRLTPGSEPKQRVASLLKRLKGVLGEETPDSQLIGRYYRQLHSISHETLSEQQWVSLTHFIAPLFRQVGSQPVTTQTEHARAALLAMARYFGERDFAALIDIDPNGEVLAEHPHQRTLLRGRIDLRQHFIYSAALQVLAEEGLSHALGEMKELLDARPGGSGFSFADLAADRAGTLFASRLTGNTNSAQQLLQRLAQPLREGDLMIPIDRLPEGIDDSLFNSAYRDTSSPAYHQLIDTIDQQLLALRLYHE